MMDDGLSVMVCGLPPVALVVWAFKFGITFPTSWAGVGWSLVVVAAVVIAVGVLLLLVKRAPVTAFPIDTHSSGHSMAHVRRHENGHARVARGCGGSAHVDLKAGKTYVHGSFTPTESAAIALGGRAAAGGAGCEEDDAIVNRWVAQGADRSAAWRIARRYA